MKKLILHLGYPRTGTKTLQFYLFKKHSGINYLGRFPDHDNSHNEIIIKILSLSNEEFEDYFAQLLIDINNLRFELDKINLISDEFFLLNDFLYNKIPIENSIERINRICKASHIDLEILLSIRNQTEIIKSIYIVTFLTSLKTNIVNLINQIKGKDTDYYTKKFLSSFDYFSMFNKISHFISEENINVIFFEKLKYDPVDYYNEISKILKIDNLETIRLTKDRKVHTSSEMIFNDPNLSTSYEIFLFKLKNLKKIDFLWNKKLFLNFKSFFFKITRSNKIKNKIAKSNRDSLIKELYLITANEKNIKKKYFLSNKKIFEKFNLDKKYAKYYF